MDAILHFFQISSGLDVELFRISFLVSIVISLLVTYKRQNAPLGIIVPGTILLLLGFPLKLLLVLVISLLVYFSALLLQKFVFSNTIFAAREKLMLFVFLSIVYSLIGYIYFNFSLEVFTAGAIGIVVPAMIADSLTKKHRVQSLKSFAVTIVYTVTFFTIIKLAALYLVTAEYKQYLNALYPTNQELSSVSVMVMYILFAIAAASNFILYRTKKLQSTGLLLGAYLGILIYQPSQILFVIFVVGIAYLLMKIIYRYTMIFGYRIFVLATVVVSCIYALTEQIVYALSNGAFHAFIGLHFAGIIVCGVLVSEMIQHGRKKVLLGSASMIVLVAGSLFLIQAFSNAVHNGFTINSLLSKTPVSPVKIVTAEEKPNVISAKKNIPHMYTHTVQRGDSLTAISERYCHTDTIQSIAKQNNLSRPNIITVGTVLTFTCIK